MRPLSVCTPALLTNITLAPKARCKTFDENFTGFASDGLKASLPMSAEELRRFVSYDPSTGFFTFLTSSRKRVAGRIAKAAHRSGYKRLQVNGKTYLQHRLAWLYVHGEWPTQQIDHINGDRADNRIANLRDVSRTTNLQNTHKLRKNITGYRGVRKERNGFKAVIQANGKVHYLGNYPDPALAYASYLDAKKRLHHGYVP